MVAADAHDRGPGKVGVTGACLCPSHLRAKWFLFGSAAFAIATVFISLSCSAAPSDSEVQFVVTKLPVLIGHDIRFTRLSTQDGLSQSRVEHVVQDDQGFMWFGTDDGLNRYDGYTFKVFRHDREETNSLGGAEVRALFKDRSGALLIALSRSRRKYVGGHRRWRRRPVSRRRNAVPNVSKRTWQPQQLGPEFCPICL